MSFNRPDLLAEVLVSLKNQVVGLDDSRIYLFQDGPKGREIPPDAFIQNECVRRFGEVFPRGQIIQSSVNLGIALNFDRAERLFFETLQAECGLFFEDDLSLSPYYLTALIQLAEYALSEPLVSYVAAYGDHTAPLPSQKEFATKIIPMGHSWGFALTKRQWLRQREIVDGYLSIVKEKDYTLRDHQRILTYFNSLGFTSGGSSQDAAKCVASLALGTTRLMCFPCFGRYIGKVGTHFTEAHFYAWKYDKTELFEHAPPTFEFPSSRELSKYVARDRALWRFRPDQRDESGLVDRTTETTPLQFIEALYASLLGRSGDPAGLAAWTEALKAGKPREDIVRAFVNSSEYRIKHGADAPKRSVKDAKNN